MPAITLKPLRVWTTLLCILAVFVYNVERWHPTVFFGRMQDDSIYFSTAKALAQGQGYVLASFPGSPTQTKYPILYPWLLSWIWKLHPSFPENLKDAVRLTEVFGCWSLVAAFLLLRKLPMISEKVALFITALCAFQPDFLRLSGLIMSDVPFMALMLTVLVLGDQATRPGASRWVVIASGTMAGLSVGMRTIGIAVVAGIFTLALVRRACREAIVLSVVAGTVVFAESWPAMMHHTAVQSTRYNILEAGWNNVFTYYTNYVQFNWRMGVPTIWHFLGMAKLNLLLLLSSPGSILVGPVSAWALPLTAVLSMPVWLGIARQYRRAEWKPIYFVFSFYCAIVLIWPWPQPERILLPLLPLFFAGLWVEIGRLGAIVLSNLCGESSSSRRLVAGALSFILLTLGVFGVWNYLVRDTRQLQLASASQAHALEERKQAYAWIRQNTGVGDRIAAYSDGALYLYTGRQGLRPVVFLPAAGYMSDTVSQENDLAHAADAARHVGVRYWLRTNDDFDLEVGKDRIDARMAEIDAALPVVFRSRENTVQIHDASCLTEVQRTDCRAVQPILFPAETQN